MINLEKSLSSQLKFFLKDKFDLIHDKENDLITIHEIKKSVEFKGANLWILIFAIIIASIGLNMDSTAVVIGAMLISPLMGPIMGIGLGAGINDFELIKKSLRNLAFASVISICTSAIYFWITPLGDVSSELLSRTRPTLWDVLIALSGGLTGVIAASRKDKSNAIPGVAIATALMPPLCTTGYGLATGNWSFFFGALYLFFINCVFISLSTLFIVRFLQYPKKEFLDDILKKRAKKIITAFLIFFITPSIWLAFNLVKDSVIEKNANQFIAEEFNFEQTKVIDKKLILNGNEKKLIVFFYGKTIEQDVIDHSKSKLELYGLKDIELVVTQGNEDKEIDLATIEEMSQRYRKEKEVIEELYQKSEQTLKSKNEQINLLENELIRLKSNLIDSREISKELSTLYPEIKEFSIYKTVLENMQENSFDTLTIANIHFDKTPQRLDQKKIQDWLTIRSKSDSLKMILY